MINNHKKDFKEIFDELSQKYARFSVWEAFIVMFACSLANRVSHPYFNDREELYKKYKDKFSQQEVNKISHLAAITILALSEKSNQDFLGELYMELGLGNKKSGQFFTPYNVCQLMAEITMSEGDVLKSEIKEKGYITINDPCCGGGALLIAGANTAKERLKNSKYDVNKSVVLFAQDIDFLCALMCYVQLSVLGMPAVVKVGDSLSSPVLEGEFSENYWMTIEYWNLFGRKS